MASKSGEVYTTLVHGILLPVLVVHACWNFYVSNYDYCDGPLCRVGDTTLGSRFCETCIAYAEHLYVVDPCGCAHTVGQESWSGWRTQ